jgi:two-component system, LytTR family, sensor kinase
MFRVMRPWTQVGTERLAGPDQRCATSRRPFAAGSGPLAAKAIAGQLESAYCSLTTVPSPPLPAYDDPTADRLGVDARWVTLVGCGAAAAIGTAIAAQVYLSMINHGHAFSRMLAWQVSSWCFWGLAAAFVLRLGSGLSIEPSIEPSIESRRSGRAARVALIGMAFCAVHMIVTAQLTVWFQPFLPLPAPTFGEAFAGQIASTLVVDLLVFGLLLAAGSAIGARHRTRALERREARLEVELARAQLEALRLEIHPHFLFNTLNSIAALIRVKDNPRALEMLLGLGELMRATVDGPRDHLVPLSTEIDFVRRYVDLQRERFADRLDIRWEIDEGSLPVPVPTLLLQPLVENAIRHGAGPQPGRCEMTISARVAGSRLYLRVSDGGAGLPAGFDIARDAGTGLRNTASRLKQLYGDLASLEVRRGDRCGAVVDVIVPSTPVVEPVRTIA